MGFEVSPPEVLSGHLRRQLLAPPISSSEIDYGCKLRKLNSVLGEAAI